MIPSIVADTNDFLIQSKIKDADGMMSSFDLWILRGFEDLFDIFAHFIDTYYVSQNVHIAMLRCEVSDGETLGRKLKSVLERSKLNHKVIGCVSVVGSKMRT